MGVVDAGAEEHIGLARRKAWHNCAGEALPRISGTYFSPSPLRTQKPGPELETTGRRAAVAAIVVD
jgi:hypothetical protein